MQMTIILQANFPMLLRCYLRQNRVSVVLYDFHHPILIFLLQKQILSNGKTQQIYQIQGGQYKRVTVSSIKLKLLNPTLVKRQKNLCLNPPRTKTDLDRQHFSA